jgi:hypothetical protein
MKEVLDRLIKEEKALTFPRLNLLWRWGVMREGGMSFRNWVRWVKRNDSKA